MSIPLKDLKTGSVYTIYFKPPNPDSDELEVGEDKPTAIGPITATVKINKIKDGDERYILFTKVTNVNGGIESDYAVSNAENTILRVSAIAGKPRRTNRRRKSRNYRKKSMKYKKRR